MSYLIKRPLTGDFADASMFFLEDNGFTNVESVSHLSMWTSHYITLFIPTNTVVTNYKQLFTLLYDAGYKKGSFESTEKLKWKIRERIEDIIFEELRS